MDYQVLLNNGQMITLGEATFNVVDFTTMLNEQTTTFVALGGAIVNKHTIMSIVPVSAMQQEQSK